jgi:hypothetical protein
MGYDCDAAMDQLAEWEEDKAMEKYYDDEWQKWNDACDSYYLADEFGEEQEHEQEQEQYLKSEEKKWNAVSRCCSNNIEMEQYYQQECEKIRDSWLSNSEDEDDALKSTSPIIDEYYKKKSVKSTGNEELKQDNNGQNNKCSMCGITGHYTRDCESDENFKQEVLDGCWTFLYCDYCGSEFFEESEHILHIESCSCH